MSTNTEPEPGDGTIRISGKHYLTLKRLAIAQLILLVLMGISFYVTVGIIQAQREASARDTCYLLRSLVLATPHGHTPAAKAYLKKTRLRDCNAYGRHVTHNTHPTQP